jgi:hypothetical protein
MPTSQSKADKDNHSVQLDPGQPTYYRSRGFSPEEARTMAEQYLQSTQGSAANKAKGNHKRSSKDTSKNG